SDWPRPSERIRELLRRGAETALNPPDEWIEEMHAAALGGVRMTMVADDPVLAEGARRTNLANMLHWA
ncbi:PucR family transcriptional regulator, partial [Streptomyces sp. SID10244]|nr:PucR family transcriptional regulator [Streptomyces sp. SID10244]